MNSYSNMFTTDNQNQQILCDSFALHFPSNSQPSSSQLSYTTNLDSVCQNNGRRKRKRKDEKETEKPKEVVHVRAKRGQATDSHSLAERVRREKINEKLRFLQHLVPGCYKAMGMAVMLDVIINYVQSLQNQIEFLSLKLSAASMHYDFNLERDSSETMHQGTNAYVLQELETMERNQEIGGPPNYFHSGDWAL